jgi:hypothetical protein
MKRILFWSLFDMVTIAWVMALVYGALWAVWGG